MTARPFSRLEPLADPRDPARSIAAFFLLVSMLGLLPALTGTLCFGLAFVSALASPGAEVLILGAVLAVIGLGIAQAGFYAGRALDHGARHARAWWLSTSLYNFVPCIASVVVLVQDPHVAPAVTALWFGALSMLALVALAAEPRRSPR